MKVLRRETLYQGFLAYDRITYYDPKYDREITREVVGHLRVATVLVYHCTWKGFIFVRQNRVGPIHTGGNPLLLEAPAGICEKDEPAYVCALREAEEECGYKPPSLEEVSVVYPSPGFFSEQMNLYYAEVTEEQRGGSGGGIDADNEFIEVVYKELRETRALLRAGQFTDAKTALLLHWFFHEKTD